MDCGYPLSVRLSDFQSFPAWHGVRELPPSSLWIERSIQHLANSFTKQHSSSRPAHIAHSPICQQ
jgi:hypothetical protein